MREETAVLLWETLVPPCHRDEMRREEGKQLRQRKLVRQRGRQRDVNKSLTLAIDGNHECRMWWSTSTTSYSVDDESKMRRMAKEER